MAGAIVAVIGAALLLTACVQTYPISRAPDGDPIQAARELPDAPMRFAMVRLRSVAANLLLAKEKSCRPRRCNA
ncbi:hypothetical protein ASD65_11760 [Microbacterium sp. Root61]|nr:hypothetical protein ASD65_11760 [Microbacterium sp. Root61]